MNVNLLATIITAVVTLLVALTGYLITYWNNIRLSQRTEKLTRINKQLGDLYGPMYSLTQTGDQVWHAFRMKFRPGNPSFYDPPLTEEELKTWCLWISTVFMPRNLQLQDLIVSKADLLIETDMPDCLKKLCAHVAAYQAVMKTWEDGDFSSHVSIIGYPGSELLEYSQKSFKDLKEKQKELLGKVAKNEV